MRFYDIVIIFLHTLAAWAGIEVFMNYAHSLPRPWFIFWHYIAVTFLFGAVFAFYFRFFAALPAFTAALIVLFGILVLEFVIFRFFYVGELWFLNYLDWFLPLFLAVSTVYFVGTAVAPR